MEDIFLSFLNMSINASYFALAVILIRLLLKKAPKWVNCLLWSLVGLRLIMPFSFESVFSLIPSKQPIPSDIITNPPTAISNRIPLLNSTVHPQINEAVANGLQKSSNLMQFIVFIASIIWLVGIVIMFSYAFLSFIRIKRKTDIRIEAERNVFLCDNIPSPFILGVLRPKIYIPSDSKEENMQYILTHEKAHIKRFDHIWKPVGFLLLSLNWFNPVLWIAYILLCRDIEGACDEKVIKELGSECKKPYSEALLDCSVKQRYISVCPLAFGETGVKQRIKNVLKYKKPAVILIVISIIIAGVAAICFLSDPKEENTEVSIDGIITRTEFDGVYLSLKSVDVKENGTKLFNCLWHNETDSMAYYGEMYDIEIKNGDEWKSVKQKDIVFTLQAYLLNPGSIQEKSYSSEFFDLSKEGTYRLICGFSTDTNNDLYTSIEFNIDISENSTAGTLTPDNTIIQRQMTIDDVIRLSKKGYELTWKDFEGYIYTEPTLSISHPSIFRNYKINERFFLHIAGEPDEKPECILINTPNGAAGISFEIRNGGVEEFIRKHENNPIIKELSWGYYISPVDSTGDNFGKMVSLGGFTEYMHYSSIRSVPVLTITSTKELDNFKSAMSDTMDFETQLSDYPSFNSVTQYFDEEFFKESDLLLLYVDSPSPLYTYTLERVYSSDDALHINVIETESDYEKQQNTGWLMAIGITKDSVKHTNKTYSQITKSYDSALSDSRTYVFRDSAAEFTEPNFKLFSSGKFTFEFSATSSYFGVGHYTIEGNELIMITDDGKYTYCFNIVGDTMVFNAEKSTDILWGTDITHGSVFY